jgi:hypothetical protein
MSLQLKHGTVVQAQATGTTPTATQDSQRDAQTMGIDELAFAASARSSRWNSKAVHGTSLAMPLVRESKGEFDASILTAHRDLAMLNRR